MINTLKTYISDSLPKVGNFHTEPNLLHKVNPNGTFRRFEGDTLVFNLRDEDKMAVGKLQQTLYDAAGFMLAAPLAPETFHMTLHDMLNAQVCDDAMQQQMRTLEHKAGILLGQWKDQPPLKMRTTWMFNMVSTSIVLGLEPADADSWERLDAMYMAMEQLVPLNRPLTPHITLAYFRPGTYFPWEVGLLRRALKPVEMVLELDMSNLELQTFSDMNTYRPA